MEIKIGNYTIMSDGCCCWIMEEYLTKSKKNKGEDTVNTRKVGGYSPNFVALLESFCKNKLKNIDATEVKDLLEQIAQVERDTSEIAKGLKNIGKGQE